MNRMYKQNGLVMHLNNLKYISAVINAINSIFSQLEKHAERAMYFSDVFFCIYFIIYFIIFLLNGQLLAPVSQDLLDWSSPNFQDL